MIEKKWEPMIARIDEIWAKVKEETKPSEEVILKYSNGYTARTPAYILRDVDGIVVLIVNLAPLANEMIKIKKQYRVQATELLLHHEIGHYLLKHTDQETRLARDLINKTGGRIVDALNYYRDVEVNKLIKDKIEALAEAAIGLVPIEAWLDELLGKPTNAFDNIVIPYVGPSQIGIESFNDVVKYLLNK